MQTIFSSAIAFVLTVLFIAAGNCSAEVVPDLIASQAVSISQTKVTAALNSLDFTHLPFDGRVIKDKSGMRGLRIFKLRYGVSLPVEFGFRENDRVILLQGIAVRDPYTFLLGLLHHLDRRGKAEVCFERGGELHVVNYSIEGVENHEFD
jgi:hypothetical protein